MILEYKMDRNAKGQLATPYWIECGGFLQNPDTFTMIGFSASVHEYKIPDSVTTLSVAQCKTRAQDIHAVHPYADIDGNTMNATQVDDMVQAIIDENDIA
jgi:hypothetical protein